LHEAIGKQAEMTALRQISRPMQLTGFQENLRIVASGIDSRGRAP